MSYIISKQKSCPLCRSRVSGILHRCQSINNAINELQVQCHNTIAITKDNNNNNNNNNKIRQCQWKGYLKDLQNHQQNDCEYSQIKHIKCQGQVMTDKASSAIDVDVPHMEPHHLHEVHEDECGIKEQSQCSNHSTVRGKQIQQDANPSLDNENASQASILLVTCPYRKYGCLFQATSTTSADTHLADAAYPHLEMKVDYLIHAQNDEITALKTKLAQFEQEIHSLKNQVVLLTQHPLQLQSYDFEEIN
ncbi:hypothetical protein RFI_24426 [Reticulomyxa filosa]|uniref:TRAF-type domain-containing protein n=1 Tax=Reticulomyxa filosa TaxID=46433 RepID=X6MGE7_RETFI|nr:hypothetical protein RFI_24426 [Reticulomyxa filosa]|eukprot:ETO12949.1 hypothetical protein RFI_24426 [Reticulomyxa filosa]